MTAQTFRKKPVEIEAMQFGGTLESANRVLAWIGAHGADASRTDRSNPEAGLLIKTLEGEMLASPGDYVIRGVKGEFYPCKPDIFAATYDPANAKEKQNDPLHQARMIAEHGQDAEAPAWATAWALIDIAEALRVIAEQGPGSLT